MKRVDIIFINGHNKGQERNVSEVLANIYIKNGRAEIKKELKQTTETKELKEKGTAKKVKQ